MNRPPEFLHHPAWQGVGAIATLLGVMLATFLGGWSIYLQMHQGNIATSPPPAVVPHVNSPSTSRPTEDLNPDGSPNIVESSLRSIDENYRGMHQYFNDDLLTPLAVVSSLLIAFGLYSRFWQHPGKQTTN